MQTRPPFFRLQAVLPLLVLLTTMPAAAQDEAVPPAADVHAAPPAVDAPPAPPRAEAGVPLSHPETNEAPSQAAPAFPLDHRGHRWAVGAFSAGNVAMTNITLLRPFDGQTSAPLPNAYGSNVTLGPVPAVGARIWLLGGSGFDVGLDVGLGLATQNEQRRSSPNSSAVGNPNVEVRAYDYVPSAVYLHVATPMAVYQGRHYTMEFIPEVNFGFGWGRGTYTVAETGAPHGVQTDGHGLNIDAGVRAGPEISFGYFDLPELVVQPTVGILVHWDSTFAGSRMGENRGEMLDGHTNVNSAVARLDASVSMLYYF